MKITNILLISTFTVVAVAYYLTRFNHLEDHQEKSYYHQHQHQHEQHQQQHHYRYHHDTQKDNLGIIIINLFIVRHGEREDFLKTKREEDPSLSLLGFKQAKETSSFLNQIISKNCIHKEFIHDQNNEHPNDIDDIDDIDDDQNHKVDNDIDDDIDNDDDDDENHDVGNVSENNGNEIDYENAVKSHLDEKSMNSQCENIILSSPYLRCIQTAHPLSQILQSKIHIEPGIMEWNRNKEWNYEGFSYLFMTQLSGGHDYSNHRHHHQHQHHGIQCNMGIVESHESNKNSDQLSGNVEALLSQQSMKGDDQMLMLDCVKKRNLYHPLLNQINFDYIPSTTAHLFVNQKLNKSETVFELANRYRRAIEDTIERVKARSNRDLKVVNLIIFSHASPIFIGVRELLGDLKAQKVDIRTGVASVTHLQRIGTNAEEWRMILNGETSHLTSGEMYHYEPQFYPSDFDL